MKTIIAWVLIITGTGLFVMTFFQGGLGIKSDAVVNDNLKYVANRINAVGGLALIGIGTSILVTKD